MMELLNAALGAACIALWLSMILCGFKANMEDWAEGDD